MEIDSDTESIDAYDYFFSNNTGSLNGMPINWEKNNVGFSSTLNKNNTIFIVPKQQRSYVNLTGSNPPGKNGPPVHGESTTKNNQTIVGGLVALSGGIGMLFRIPGSQSVVKLGFGMMGWGQAEEAVDIIKEKHSEQGK